MFSHLALAFAERYLQQMGVQDYTMDYVDILLKPQEKKEIQAKDKYWFIVHADSCVQIESNEGVYSLSNTEQGAHKRVHTGIVSLHNLSDTTAKIEVLECYSPF
jgi:hypothetical protein